MVELNKRGSNVILYQRNEGIQEDSTTSETETTLGYDDTADASLLSNIITTRGEGADIDEEEQQLPHLKQDITDSSKFNILSIVKLVKSQKKRIAVAFLIVNLGFPLYLAYNAPTALVKIVDSDDFTKLFSVYAIPNVAMVFLGGILVDLIGANKCSLIFSSILTISTILASISVNHGGYGLLLFSRILLGIGGETLLVCVASFIGHWFEESQQSMVFGVESAWMQLGSLLGFGLLPTLSKHTNLATTFWFVSIIAIICTALNFLFVFTQHKLSFNKELPIELINQDNDDEDTKDGEFETLSIEDDNKSTLGNSDSDGSDGSSQSKWKLFKMNIIKAWYLVKTMPTRIWLLALVSFFGYSGFFGLDIIFTDMAIEKYGYTDTKAALIMAFETFCTGASSPLSGYIVKKLQRNILSMTIGISMILIGIILITITPSTINPIAFVVTSGIGYGLMSNSIYSSIPLVADGDSQGTAFGIMGTSYNIGIVIFPFILSSFRIRYGSYFISMWVLVVTTIMALLSVVLLKYYDRKETNQSNRLDRKNYSIKF